MATALGIDIGTTSISFAVINEDEILFTDTLANSSTLKESNYCQDADEILKIVKTEVDEILDKYKIDSIGFTGQMHGIVYTDGSGKAASPLYTWKTQTGNLIYKNNKTYCEYIYETTGEEVSTGYGLVTHFVNAMNGLQPEKAEKICTISDYIAMRLGGMRIPVVHASNAASLGFYNCIDNEFDELSLKKLGIDTEILPKTDKNCEIIGEYRKIPIYISIGDNQASFIGSVKNADCLINIGTGGQVSVRTCKAEDDINNGIELRPLNNKEYLLVYSSLCGGRAYALLESFVRETVSVCGLYCESAYEALNDSARQAYTRGTGVKTKTLFSGTRQNPKQRASIMGISAENFKIGDIALSFLEGIADEICTALFKIEQITGEKQNRIFVSGNGIQKNELLMRIFEDKLKASLILSDYKEEAAVGAAKFSRGERYGAVIKF